MMCIVEHLILNVMKAGVWSCRCVGVCAAGRAGQRKTEEHGKHQQTDVDEYSEEETLLG